MPLEYQVPLVSFLFILIINSVYFLKRKVNLIENKAYCIILIGSLIVSIIDTILHIISSNCDEIQILKYMQFVIISNKIMSSLFCIIFSSLLTYIVLISYKKTKENFKIFGISLSIVNILIILFIFLSKVEVINAGTARNVSGNSIMIGYLFVGLILFVSFWINLIHFNKRDKRFMAFFLIVLTIGVMYFFTIFFPGIIIYDLILAIMCYIMYFTIENPDVKMLNEITLAKNELEQANQIKSDFISSMSHEIRTPVNGIVGLGSLLLEEEDLNNCKEEIKDMIDSSQKLLSITDKMFEIYAIEKQKDEEIKTEYNPKKEIENVIELYLPRIKDKNLIFNNKLQEMISVYGNLTILKKVTSQILDNAIKFTNKGSITINSKLEKNNLKIEIEDTGIGIKEEEIMNIFTPFKKTKATKNSSYSGVGVGLSITKSLLEKVNGEIKIFSKYEKGTKVMISLPIERKMK